MTVPPLEYPVLHNRVYDVVAYRKAEDRLLLRGTVMDTKPAGVYIPDDPEPMTIHRMVVDIEIGIPDLVIVDARLVMEVHPHVECRRIEDHYQELIGLSITRGYTHKVRELFGGPRGCTHTTALLQAMGPVAFQSMWSMRMEESSGVNLDITIEEQRERTKLNLNTCHVWAEDGPMLDRLNRDVMLPMPIWAADRLRKLGKVPEGWRNGDE